MIRGKKHSPMLLSFASRLTLPPPAAAHLSGNRRAGDTVPAAWPSGMDRLGISAATCATCASAEACEDWLTRVPEPPHAPPPFCPHAGDVRRTKLARG